VLARIPTRKRATLIDEFFQLFDDAFRVSSLEAAETARVNAEILATQEDANANGPGRPKGIFHYELPVINDGYFMLKGEEVRGRAILEYPEVSHGT
jgi:hypothetical protein